MENEYQNMVKANACLCQKLRRQQKSKAEKYLVKKYLVIMIQKYLNI